MITAETFYGKAKELSLGGGNRTLNPLEARVYVATNAGSGNGVVLPLGADVHLGGPIFIIYNNGASSFPILKNDLTTLGTLTNGYVAVLCLVRQSGQGTWFLDMRAKL